MLGASRAALIGLNQIKDQFYSSTSLILSFEGSNGATSTVDESPIGHTITFNRDAAISTAQVGEGVSSLLLDGTGDYLTLADHASLQLNGDFTIEFKIRAASAAPSGVLRLQESGAGYPAQAFYYDGTGLFFLSSSTGNSFDIANLVTVAASLSVGTWANIAVTRSGSTYSTYLNGTRISTFTNGSTPVSGFSSAIGATTGGGFAFNGNIDQVRITKGIARYTGASYTLPSGLFPTS